MKMQMHPAILPLVALVLLLSMFPPRVGQCDTIHDAVRSGDIAAATRILASDPSALNARDQNGYTPLYTAAAWNNVALFRFLLERGADPRLTDNWGSQPIHQAAHYDAEMVTLLLAKGVHVNARGHFQHTPLHEAASTGTKKDIVELLIARGADVNAVDEGGWTPLHDACRVTRDIGFRPAPEEMVELLVRRGATINARDNQGRTPLAVALAWGNRESAAVLRSRGAE